MPSGGFDMDILPALNGGGHESGAILRYTNLDDAAILSMVSHDLGYSILSELVVQGAAENVRILRLSPPTFRELGIIISPDWETDANLKTFVTCARETVEKMYA
jgi:DNA-binding transcriptional LysR family regulator